MSPLPENFDALRRLLGLKRHEQPPPGFFLDFPDRVLARLEMADAHQAVPWWRRYFEALDLKPALAAAFGLAVVSMYFVGLTLADFRGEGLARADTPTALPLYLPAQGTAGEASAEVSHFTLASGALPITAPSMSPVVSVGPPRGLFSPGSGLNAGSLQRVRFSLDGR
jgi:hypothetical protein